MADWQFKLDLKDAWKKAENDEINTVELSKVVVEKIKALVVEIRERANNPKDVVERIITKDFIHLASLLENEILPPFEEIVDTENDDTEAFDYALSDLYDWGDTKLDSHWNGRKMCWISTVI